MKEKFFCTSVKPYRDKSEAMLALVKDEASTVESSKMRIMSDCKEVDNFFKIGKTYSLEAKEVK